MHSNPFSSVGYDLSDIHRQLNQKADQHEIHSLRSTLERIERSIDMARDEQRREIDSLRSRCERLETLVLELNPDAHIAGY